VKARPVCVPRLDPCLRSRASFTVSTRWTPCSRFRSATIRLKVVRIARSSFSAFVSAAERVARIASCAATVRQSNARYPRSSRVLATEWDGSGSASRSAPWRKCDLPLQPTRLVAPPCLLLPSRAHRRWHRARTPSVKTRRWGVSRACGSVSSATRARRWAQLLCVLSGSPSHPAP
jgi:hypothetical protein